MCVELFVFFFQAEDGIRDLVRSRGLGDVYKRQTQWSSGQTFPQIPPKGLLAKMSPADLLKSEGLPLSLIHI